MLEQPKAGLISRFYRQVENRLKNHITVVVVGTVVVVVAVVVGVVVVVVVVVPDLVCIWRLFIVLRY